MHFQIATDDIQTHTHTHIPGPSLHLSPPHSTLTALGQKLLSTDHVSPDSVIDWVTLLRAHFSSNAEPTHYRIPFLYPHTHTHTHSHTACLGSQGHGSFTLYSTNRQTWLCVAILQRVTGYKTNLHEGRPRPPLM